MVMSDVVFAHIIVSKEASTQAYAVASNHVGAIQPYSDAESKAQFIELARSNSGSSIYLIRNKIIDQELETKPIQRCCSNRTKRDETLLVI